MPKGYTGSILRVDLTTQKIDRLEPDEDFYRIYLGGGALGGYFLLREAKADLDPLHPGNLLTIAPGVTTGAAVSGVSRCCVTALSPLTGMLGDSQAGGNIGPAVKRAGYDALVISGRADKPCYLLVEPDRVEIRDARQLSGKLTLQVLDMLTSELGKRDLSVLQCGPAGERLVRFACLMADGYDVAGRTGMGAVFGSKNLRAVAVRGNAKIPFADPEGLKELAQKAAKRLPDSGFPATLHQYGTPGVLSFQAQAGNLATHNYSRGFTPDYQGLAAESFEPVLYASDTTCYGCVVRCRKKVRTEESYKLTDRLGGPEFETLGMLGSNLDITDAAAVARASQLCGAYGLDTITMGGLAGYLFECMENGLIAPEQVGGKRTGFGAPEDLYWLIERVGLREGIGDVLAEGFTAAVQHFGKQTEPYAVHVKNQGLAVHMPQVKPSQALMYAVCPIGPDHMSCEHDWLLAAGGEEAKGLGIFGRGDAASCDLDKVRMTVYSQHYYSLLDALCLCMFCWGPGNLFGYRELEDLLRYTTGWQCTFWELMKAGERRVNLMRQVNAKRGFGADQDKLPGRVFKPLPDGPSQGRRVDENSFREMRDMYYNLMGWNPDTGNPTAGKLWELGLEWSLL